MKIVMTISRIIFRLRGNHSVSKPFQRSFIYLRRQSLSLQLFQNNSTIFNFNVLSLNYELKSKFLEDFAFFVTVVIDGHWSDYCIFLMLNRANSYVKH